jgi:hypothetical protein
LKRLHRPDLYGWSVFDEARDIDFHSVVWVRPQGNVLIDPLAMCEHDLGHLRQLGGASRIVITNSDHVRDAARLAMATGAELLGPKGEADAFPLRCARWLAEGEQVVPGLEVIEMRGSKTPGELALILDASTLITGDLIRAHEGGRLCLLPEAKLSDKSLAIASVRRVAELSRLEAVLPGDGWPVFSHAREALGELLSSLC